MKNVVRRVLPVLAALLLVGVVAWMFIPAPVPVDLETVTRGPLQVTVDEDGRTRIKDKYVVSTPLAGRLRRITLRAGDPVAAGETQLAVIEPTDPELLDPRARAQAEARVRAAEAALAQAAPRLEQALAAMQFAEGELARARRLHERATLTRSDLEERELHYQTRMHEYRTARFAEEIARYELDLARAALIRAYPDEEEAATDNNARNNWYFPISSPITGRVLRVFQESETVVPAGSRLLELGDPTDLEVEVDVLSNDGVRIQPDARVTLERWGGDHPLRGTVRYVEPSAFTKMSALGVEEQRVNVIIDLIDPPEVRRSLGDGFRVDARIVVWEAGNALRVPVSALFRHGDDWAVFVERDGRAVLRTVVVGQRDGFHAEVLEGLAEGETVVIHPGDRIGNGVRITPREEAASRADSGSSAQIVSRRQQRTSPRG